MSRFRLTSPRVKLVENDVEKVCIELLRLRGYYVVRLQVGKFLMPDEAVLRTLKQAGIQPRWIPIGEPGLPDYVCIKHDFFLETKRPGGKLLATQMEKAIELAANRIAVATIDSVEHLAKWLDEREQR